MNFKDVRFGDQARLKMIEGIDVLANAVKATLGPRGRNVVIKRKFTGPQITKDGVTVAKNIHLRDEFMDMGAQLILEAASQTNEHAGDGPQPLSAKILTPDGWTTMGELKVDQVICGTNGSYQTVDTIFDKGIREIYQVTFSDDQVVECCLDHLWTVVDNSGRPTKKTLPLRRLISDYKSANDKFTTYRYYVPNHIPEMESRLIPIHPFTLGVLIGDGSLTGETIEISLGLNKEWVINALILPEGIEKKVTWVEDKNYFRIKLQGKTVNGNTMVDLIKSLKLDVKSADKFIPEDYLFNTISHRHDLLEGLTATDGHINTRLLLEYSTISEQLAKDVHQLILSLGRHTKIDFVERKGNSYSDTPIYRLYERQGYNHGIKIVDIKTTGRFEETKCILVSNDDHLYITNDYILTHNTTTSTVLAQAIIKEGIRYIDRGVGAVEIKRGIDKATEFVINRLKQQAVPISGNDDLIKIARISANSDDVIANLITQALDVVGRDGLITVERGGSIDELEISTGMRFSRGWVNSNFTGGSNLLAEYERPMIVLLDKPADNFAELERVLNIASADKKPMLLIAHSFSDEVMNILVSNHRSGNLTVCPVEADGYGDRRSAILEDIAIYTGGVVFGTANGNRIERCTTNQFGNCDRVSVSSAETAIIGRFGDEKIISERVERLRAEYEVADSVYKKDRIQERLGSLTNGVAVIRVGGHTDAEMKEKKDRVDDAVCAVRASLSEGFLPGGGTALLRLSKELNDLKVDNEDQAIGVKILQRAIKAPFYQISENAGKNGEVNEHRVVFYGGANNFNTGYDASTDLVDDMITLGIIDPAKVTRVALQNAASIAGIFLTTEVAIGWDGADKTDNIGFFAN